MVTHTHTHIHTHTHTYTHTYTHDNYYNPMYACAPRVNNNGNESTEVQTLGVIRKTEKTFKNEQRSKDAAAKKRPNTSGVGKINNYYEDIYMYIPPYNNTD